MFQSGWGLIVLLPAFLEQARFPSVPQHFYHSGVSAGMPPCFHRRKIQASKRHFVLPANAYFQEVLREVTPCISAAVPSSPKRHSLPYRSHRLPLSSLRFLLFLEQRKHCLLLTVDD